VRAMQYDAGLLIFDLDLTPGQATPFSDFTDLKVIDRTILILDIFAQAAARSRDAKLQVELGPAALSATALAGREPMMSRLVGRHRRRGQAKPNWRSPPPRAASACIGWNTKSSRPAASAAGRRAERTRREVPIVGIVATPMRASPPCSTP